MASVPLDVCSSEEEDEPSGRAICTNCGVVTLPHSCSRGRVHVPDMPLSHSRDDMQEEGDVEYNEMFGLPDAKKARVDAGGQSNMLTGGIDALRTLLSDHDAREKQLAMVNSHLETSQQTTAYFQAELAKEKAASALVEAASQATIEIQKSAMELKEKTIAEQAKKYAEQAKKLKAATDKKSKAKGAAAAAASASGRTPILSLYDLLVRGVIKTYQDKGTRHQANWTPPPAPAPPPPAPAPPAAPAAGPPVTMILQKIRRHNS